MGDSYGYDVTAKPASYAAGWIAGQRVLEVATSFDGSGASAKQLQTTREGLYDENGDLQVSTEESTTYYLRSTALGGKVVAELDQHGSHMKNHVFAGGMELAQPFGYQGATYVNWQHTDPVTGSSFTSDTSRTFATQKEIGTLGEDVTTPPPPTPRMPVFFQSAWPVEMAWGGPSQYYNDGNAEWQTNMDAVAAQNFYDSKAYGFAAMIVAKNPNVLVKIDGKGQRAADLVWLFGEEFNLQLDKKGEIHTTLFGAQAGAFLEGYGEFKDAAGQKKIETNDPNELIHCDPKVQARIGQILQSARFSAPGGGTGIEFGFNIDRINGELVLGNTVQSKVNGTDVTVPISENTIATVHTHTFGGRNPSTQDKDNARGRGSLLGKALQGHKTVAYISSPAGLRIFNGTNPTDSSGRDRIIDAPKCPRPIKKE